MTVALSLLNFRDIGGLRTADNATVKRGALYRSEGPASFLEDHHAELGALGFRTVCDLRSSKERHEAPNDWCGPNCRLLDLDIDLDARLQKDIWESFRGDRSNESAMRVVGQNYAMIPEALTPYWPMVVGALISGETPMMLHCTAGKDRTGVAIALLLLLLGVGRDDVYADYAKSNVFGENMRKAGTIESGFTKTFGFVPADDVIDLLIGTHPEFLTRALETVERAGPIESYFENSGVAAKQQQQLRAALLEA
jgi:protein-tyrosine phosphatase